MRVGDNLLVAGLKEKAINGVEGHLDDLIDEFFDDPTSIHSFFFDALLVDIDYSIFLPHLSLG